MHDMKPGEKMNRHSCMATLLVALFIVAQFFAATHASEHAFHAADNSCIVLSSAENNSPVVGMPVCRLQSGEFRLVQAGAYSAPYTSYPNRAFRTRAPPLLIS